MSAPPPVLADCRYAHHQDVRLRVVKSWSSSCGRCALTGAVNAARRMAENSHYLLGQVIPHVPMRQWVVSFPWPRRMVFAARPAWLSRVRAIVSRAISSAVIARAGLGRNEGAPTGTITFVQRYGPALNLNIHLHMLVPEGAYTFAHGRAR